MRLKAANYEIPILQVHIKMRIFILSVTPTRTVAISESFTASYSHNLLDVIQMALDSWLALSADVLYQWRPGYQHTTVVFEP